MRKGWVAEGARCSETQARENEKERERKTKTTTTDKSGADERNFSPTILDVAGPRGKTQQQGLTTLDFPRPEASGAKAPGRSPTDSREGSE
jgi:hypothetical protein